MAMDREPVLNRSISEAGKRLLSTLYFRVAARWVSDAESSGDNHRVPECATTLRPLAACRSMHTFRVAARSPWPRRPSPPGYSSRVPDDGRRRYLGIARSSRSGAAIWWRPCRHR